MRIRLTLDITREKTPRALAATAGAEPREVQLDALVERSDPHPPVERPAGFRAPEPSPYEETRRP